MTEQPGEIIGRLEDDIKLMEAKNLVFGTEAIRCVKKVKRCKQDLDKLLGEMQRNVNSFIEKEIVIRKLNDIITDMVD